MNPRVDKQGITVSKPSDLRLLEMTRSRVAGDLDIDPHDIGNIETFRWAALAYIEGYTDVHSPSGLDLRLNGTSDVLIAALVASGEADPESAIEAVARQYLDDVLEAIDTKSDCNHLDAYKMQLGGETVCARCIEDEQTADDRSLLSDLIDDQRAIPS